MWRVWCSCRLKCRVALQVHRVYQREKEVVAEREHRVKVLKLQQEDLVRFVSPDDGAIVKEENSRDRRREGGEWKPRLTR